MTKNDLKKACATLRGPNVQDTIAAMRGVDPRTARGWCEGRSGVPEDIKETLFQLCEKRVAELEGLLAKLK